MFLQNALLENIRRLERHHTPREDRHFLTRLGVTTDTLVLVANLKCRKDDNFTVSPLTIASQTSSSIISTKAADSVLERPTLR